MSVYTRLQKVIQDFALGFQTLNAAVANVQTLRDWYAGQHGIGEHGPTKAQDPKSFLGHHNTTLVPRAVAHVTAPTNTAPARMDAISSGAMITGLQFISTGYYLVSVREANQNGWLTGTAESTAVGTKRLVDIGPTGLYSAVVYVKTYELSGGVFALANFDFTLTYNL